jgi:hypothetical protein
MAYDYGLSEVVLFGGYSTSRLGDTWTYKGGVWTNITSSLPNSPSPRYYALMTYDSADGYLLLTGGSPTNINQTNQTWIFNGSTWTQTSGLLLNYWYGGDLYGPDMAYDSSLGKVVLSGLQFGATFGYGAGSWSGLPSGNPCDIYDPGTYDAADGYMVMLGGNGSYLTCKLTGSGWSTVPTVTEPPLAGYSRMTYDDVSQAVVFPMSKIFPASCYTPFSCSQTWGFNGGNWTNITSLSTLEPSGRAGAAVAYDAADGYTVFFGGANESVMLGDTWTLKVVTTHVPTYPVTFDESGLATGTKWSVTLNGFTNTSTTSSMSFAEKNGTYAYSVTPVSGYSSSISAGNISVSGSSPVPVSVTFYPYPLASVAVSPTVANITTGALQAFSTSLSCTGGACPLGAAYSWTVTNPSMGSLNSSTAPDVLFTAGSTTGHLALFLNVTLNGVTVMSAPAYINMSQSSSTLKITSLTAYPDPLAVDQTTEINVTATGGNPPYTYTYSGLPTGCASSNVSSIACAPSNVGNYTVVATVYDSKANSASAAIQLTVTGPVTLIDVALSPVVPSVGLGMSQPFTATPACSSTCPVGTIVYSWALTSTLGSLSVIGPEASFTAGSTSGTVGIFVNATLSGTIVEASTEITVTSSGNALNSVSVSPTSATIVPLGNEAFTATPSCTFACPSGITYSWTLSSSNMGTLNNTVGTVTIFYAGSDTGTVGLIANATLNGFTAESTPVIITISTAGPLTITSFTISPTPIDVGVTTYLNVSVGGGSSPYTYVYAGLPTGCLSTNTASLSCTPTSPGTFGIGVQVSDQNDNERTMNTTLLVNPDPTVALVPTRDSVDIGETFLMHTQLTGGSGVSQLSFVGAGGTTGCNLLVGTMDLECLPTAVGSFSVTVHVTDIFGRTASNTSHTVVVAPALSAGISVTSSTVILGEPVEFILNATGGLEPYTYSYAGLPPGCESVNNHTVGCLPTQVGSYTVVGNVTDLNGMSALTNVSLKVLFDFTVSSPPTAQVGQQIQLIVKAEGGYGTLTYAYSGLPFGCSSADTPALNCTPTVAGLYIITISVHDQVGNRATHQVSLYVSPASPSPSGTLGLTTTQWEVLIACIVAGIVIILLVVANRTRRARSGLLGGRTSPRSGRTPHMSSYDEYGKKPAAPARPAGAAKGGEKPAPEIALDDLL